MTPDGAVDAAARVVRVRTEVAARGQDLRLRRAGAAGATTCRSAPGCACRFHGRTRAGLGGRRRTSRRPPASTSCPLKSWLGWGPPPAVVELARVGRLALGRSGLVLPRTRVARRPSCGRLPAPPPWRRVAATGRPGARRRRTISTWRRPGSRSCACPRRPIRSTWCCPSWTDPAVRARGGSVLVLVPSAGWAERLAARLVRRGCPAAGAWEQARAGLARRGRQPGRRLGPGAPAGGRRRARCPRRRLPGGERARPTARSTCCSSGPGGRASPASWPRRCRRWRWPRAPALRTVAPSRPAERAGWPVLERVDRRGADPRSGMFSEEFVRLARSVLDDAAARASADRWSASTTARAVPGCWPASTAASWPAAPAAVPPRRRPRGEEVLRCPRCGETPPGGVRGLRPAAHEDAAGRREPPARGAGRPARRRGGRGGRSAGGRTRARRARGPGAGRHRGRAAPGAPGRRRGLPRHRPAPAGARASRRPRRRWPCSCGPPGWSVPAAPARPGPGCWSRPGCPTTRCSRRSRSASRRRCWPRRPRCAAPPRCRRSSRWPLVSGALAPAYAEALRRGGGRPAAEPSAVGLGLAPLGDGPLPRRAPTPTSRCATSWPACPGRRGGAARRGRPGHRSERRPAGARTRSGRR